MLRDEEKRLQMARSLLPSAHARVAAREKQKVKKRARAQVRQMLARAARAPDHEPDDADDLRAWPHAELRQIVVARRGHDKVAPFLRWAKARTAHLPHHSRLSAMRGVVPRGLVGDHAIDHLRWSPEFGTDPHAWWRVGDWTAHVRARAQEHAAQLESLCDEIPQIVRSGDGHRALHDALRAHHAARVAAAEKDPNVVAPPLRLLAGLHDVDDFITHLRAPLLRPDGEPDPHRGPSPEGEPRDAWDAVVAFVARWRRGERVPGTASTAPRLPHGYTARHRVTDAVLTRGQG